jgi:predicted HTH domain antitoxin
MKMIFDIPKEITDTHSPSMVQKEMPAVYAVWLYKAGIITLSKGALLAGLNLMEFMQFCSSNGVAVIDESEEDFLQEIAMIKSL